MAEFTFSDSNYRFTDPVRFFKANDPYYFEVDNIPLKQLQENCLWLRDQMRDGAWATAKVKRNDIDELRPFANGGDRTVRVKPGRYSARINDLASKQPLAYLEKVMGDHFSEQGAAWLTALPNEGWQFPGDKGELLEVALDSFKSTLAQDAKGMTGLTERAFTWPVFSDDLPVNYTGVVLEDTGSGPMNYGDGDVNVVGGGAAFGPMVITQALIWAKSPADVSPRSDASYLYTFYDIYEGFSRLPRTESYFIKKWRGVSRLAIVDVSDEISIEVPTFDPDDFAYLDENGEKVQVDNVTSRIDLVFIYSKPVDASSVTLLKPSGKEVITKPSLGIVRGAGLKTIDQTTTAFNKAFKIPMDSDNHRMLAHPADQFNENMGFTATSSNDIAASVRGSFPAPDDILNLAPLISERLEDGAWELLGQSILPVAYVWVQAGSYVVKSTDVIDIRPLFRTAELTYNERAGIGAAFPQISIANPAVGEAQLDLLVGQSYEKLNNKIDSMGGGEDARSAMNTLATGYVFGGWFFGPEAALYNFWAKKNGSTYYHNNETIKSLVRFRYGYGSTAAYIEIPYYPDWDLSQWAKDSGNWGLQSPGQYPNDYINTFVSRTETGQDPSIAAGSHDERTLPNTYDSQGNIPSKLVNFGNVNYNPKSQVNFHYVSKRIKFNRPEWLGDYKVSVDFVNCLPQNNRGLRINTYDQGSYGGIWVDKGWDYFTIYVAFVADDNINKDGTSKPRFIAPHEISVGGQTYTVSQRDGEDWSGFVVPVDDILRADTTSMGAGFGYTGNPRIGKCTYPTVMWTVEGVPLEDGQYLYGNLNGTDPIITLKG